jgi:glycosyltransferase involved in cell wall biosynthesis
MPRSIVHLTTVLHGGDGGAITELACAQRGQGDDILLVASASGALGFHNEPHYRNRLESAGVPVVAEDSLFERTSTLTETVVGRLRQLRPDAVDVLHAHAPGPAAIAVRFADTTETRPVLVQTQHGWGNSKTADQAKHDLDLLQAVDAVVVTSLAIREFVTSAGIATERIWMIPGGIPPRAPQPSAIALATIGRIRNGGGRVVVGCIGEVNDNKNQALLVRALAAEGARNVHAVFIGAQGETLNTRARELGVADRVHTLGYQPEAETWVGLFDAVIVPSRVAKRGLVVLEAFRAGVPVVASNVPPLGELVTDYDTGWLFESDDARSLATAIGRATSIRREIRNHIVDAAARKFLAGYTTEIMLARHAELYDAVRNRV